MCLSSQAGVLEGLLVLIFVAGFSVKAMLLVVDCKYALVEKQKPKKTQRPEIRDSGEWF